MESCKIVMADDDSDDRDFFKEALESKREAELSQFKDGIELLAYLNKMTILPKIIFLDLNMPFKSGHECLTDIRSKERYKNIPIAIYTTSSNQNHIESTFNAGANLYIVKPASFVKIGELMEIVFSLNVNEYLPKPSKEKYLLSIS